MKRVLIFGGAALGVLVAVLLAAPLIISTDFVKRQIVSQVATWTGRDVSFGGDPEVHLLPDLTVRLHDVALANPPEMGGGAFIEAEAISGRLRLLPLLLGRIEIAEFRLFNPRISLVVDATGRPNWELDRSAVGAQAAKGDAEVPSDDIAPRSPLADISLGRVVVRNGTISYDDRRSGRHEELTDVRVNLAWPSSQEAVTGDGTFSYRGTPLEFNGAITAPLQLLAGGASPVRLAVASSLLRVSLAGTASHLDGLQIEGDTTATTPSLRGLLAWTGTDLGEGSILGAASVSGKMNWIGPSIAFSPAKLELDGNVAVGALAFAIGERPGIQGTLALDRLDLTAYADALRAAADAGAFAPDAPVRLPLAALGDVDLRISTDQATIGRAAIGRAAIAANVKDGKLTLNIGDAQLYGGRGEATLAAAMEGATLNATLDGTLDQVPIAAALAGLTGLSGLDGAGSATLDLTASGTTWGAVADSLAGKGTVTIANGSLAGIDIRALPGSIPPEGQPAPAGATTFTSASASLSFAGTSVDSSDSRAEGPAFALDLSGKASLASPAIAGRGVLSLPATANAAASEIPFMVSGTFAAPLFYPDLGRPFTREQGMPAPDAPEDSPRG